MSPVTLETARLVLSTPGIDDIDAIVEAVQDPEIPRWTTVPSPYSRSHAEHFVASMAERWETGTDAVWAVRHDDALAGMIGLHRVDAGSSAELGYWVAVHARGQGLLTEAAEAVLGWGFDADGLDLRRVEWRAIVGNVPSARSARKLGFRFEGTLRQAAVDPRGRHDAWVAGLLRDDDRTPVSWPILP